MVRDASCSFEPFGTACYARRGWSDCVVLLHPRAVKRSFQSFECVLLLRYLAVALASGFSVSAIS